jgi:hypothetical protein
MKKIYSPQNEVELAVIKSLLDGENIPYYVHNELFGSMEVGPQIPLFNKRTIMVPEEFEESARGLIGGTLPVVEPEEDEKPTWENRLRMILEALFFTWFIPGKRRQIKD